MAERGDPLILWQQQDDDELLYGTDSAWAQDAVAAVEAEARLAMVLERLQREAEA